MKCKLCKNKLNIYGINYKFLTDRSSINSHRRVCESCKESLLLFEREQIVELYKPKIIYDFCLIKETEIYKHFR